MEAKLGKASIEFEIKQVFVTFHSSFPSQPYQSYSFA